MIRNFTTREANSRCELLENKLKIVRSRVDDLKQIKKYDIRMINKLL